MKIGVLGTGMVGEAIASKLVTLGHQVSMGSRTANNPRAQAWVARAGVGAGAGTFAEAAAFGELLFNCTNGVNSLEALRAAGGERLADKILIDVTNRLAGAVPSPASLAEEIQQEFPAAKVVKTLNTVNCALMVNPASLPAAHSLFMSGNDAGAKGKVRELLASFGWKDVIDLGDLHTARATEGYVALWIALYKSLGTLSFNVAVVR
jgi:8-hydroxy-5-deazaflavin:NADPH oxidoreductase